MIEQRGQKPDDYYREQRTNYKGANRKQLMKENKGRRTEKREYKTDYTYCR